MPLPPQWERLVRATPMVSNTEMVPVDTSRSGLITRTLHVDDRGRPGALTFPLPLRWERHVFAHLRPEREPTSETPETCDRIAKWCT